MGKQKPVYIVVSCIGGHLSFYRETGLGMFRIFTSNRAEAKRFAFNQAIKLQDWRTFAIKESLLDKWLADPPEKVREILATQSTEG